MTIMGALPHKVIQFDPKTVECDIWNSKVLALASLRTAKLEACAEAKHVLAVTVEEKKLTARQSRRLTTF